MTFTGAELKPFTNTVCVRFDRNTCIHCNAMAHWFAKTTCVGNCVKRFICLLMVVHGGSPTMNTLHKLGLPGEPCLESTLVVEDNVNISRVVSTCGYKQHDPSPCIECMFK